MENSQNIAIEQEEDIFDNLIDKTLFGKYTMGKKIGSGN